jgi:hypothetical protein
MMSISRTIGTGVVAVLMLAGLATGAQALVPSGGIGAFGGESRGVMQITGSVVCVGCTLDEVRAAQPNLGGLYTLRHEKGQVVMQVYAVDDAARWESLVGLSHQLSMRAPDRVFQELTAEENLFKEVTITGLLRGTRTLDISEIMIPGPSIAERARAAGERARAAAAQAEAAAVRAEKAAVHAEIIAERTDRTMQRIDVMVRKLNGRVAEY